MNTHKLVNQCTDINRLIAALIESSIQEISGSDASIESKKNALDSVKRLRKIKIAMNEVKNGFLDARFTY